MAVPTVFTDLSQTAGSNPPAGSDSPNILDNQIRQVYAFLMMLYQGAGSAAEVDIASATTTTIGGALSPFIRITGTTGITSFGTTYNGPRFIRFSGALTLTHNASTLIIPGGANIVTVAGDSCIAIPISGGWYISQYQSSKVTAWTPTDGSGAALSMTTGTCTYIKEGRKVICHGDVTYPVTADGTAASIGGLPFTIGTAYAGVAIGLTTDTAAITMYGNASSTIMPILAASGGGVRTNANCSGKRYLFTIVYFT